SDLLLQLDPERMAPQAAAFNKRCAKPTERIQNPVAPLGVTPHHLVRNLRYEIAPVAGGMDARIVAPVDGPQAIQIDVNALFPAVEIDVVYSARTNLDEAFYEPLHVVDRALQCLRSGNLIEFLIQM